MTHSPGRTVGGRLDQAAPAASCVQGGGGGAEQGGVCGGAEQGGGGGGAEQGGVCGGAEQGGGGGDFLRAVGRRLRVGRLRAGVAREGLG
jgi:hypothetical protein